MPNLLNRSDVAGKEFERDNALHAGRPLEQAIRNYALDAYPGGYQAMRAEPARMLQTKSWSEMFSSVASEIQKGGPGVGGTQNTITITRISPIINSVMQVPYVEKKRNIRTAGRVVMRGDQWSSNSVKGYADAVANLIGVSFALNEVILFHGTNKDAASHIIGGGFNRDFKKSNSFTGYGALGWGTYFSDNFAKCATYVPCNTCKQAQMCHCTRKRDNTLRKERVVLMCRVVLGNSEDLSSTRSPCYLSWGMKPFKWYNSDQALPPEFHSRIWLKPDGSEYMVPDNHQAMVTHLIYYTLTEL